MASFMLLAISPLSAQKTVQDQGEKFNTLLYYMNRMYVDSVDLDGLVETAIRGMLEELDPHSVYILPKTCSRPMSPSTESSKASASVSTS